MNLIRLCHNVMKKRYSRFWYSFFFWLKTRYNVKHLHMIYDPSNPSNHRLLMEKMRACSQSKLLGKKSTLIFFWLFQIISPLAFLVPAQKLYGNQDLLKKIITPSKSCSHNNKRVEFQVELPQETWEQKNHKETEGIWADLRGGN